MASASDRSFIHFVLERRSHRSEHQISAAAAAAAVRRRQRRAAGRLPPPAAPRRAAAAQAQRRRNVGRAPTGDGLPRVGRLPAALGRRTGTAARPPTAAAAAAAAEQLLAFFLFTVELAVSSHLLLVSPLRRNTAEHLRYLKSPSS